jgi:hypothetical protein
VCSLPKPARATGRLKRPLIPLRSTQLIVNGPRDLSIGPEIQRELASADRVDVLVSFLKWSGVRLVIDELRAFCDRGGTLRVLTTTYMGASEIEAVEKLVKIGADLRVSYDSRRTRHHAKAWLFYRDSGFSTGADQFRCLGRYLGLCQPGGLITPIVPGRRDDARSGAHVRWSSSPRGRRIRR